MRVSSLLRLLALLGLLSLLAIGGASAGLQIVWGPVLGDVTATSAQIAWYTSAPSYGEVRIGDQSLARGGPVQAHKVVLRELVPGATYYYSLFAEAGGQQVETRKYRLTTPAVGLPSFTFCIYGDTRSNPADHAQVVRAMMVSQPQMILHTGDLVNNGSSLEDWHHFFPVISRFSPSVPLYPCLGNHEGGAAAYYDLLPLPAGGGERGAEWYSTVYGSVQIITLDSGERQATQSAWLREVLARPRPAGVNWRIVQFHNPPYTSGPHAPDANAQKYFCPLLETGAVDLVVNGHNHYYERSRKNGLTYLTVGGGGAPLYGATLKNPYRQALSMALSFARVEVTPGQLQITVYDVNQKVLDRCTINQRQP